jgi:hypothetical protein
MGDLMPAVVTNISVIATVMSALVQALPAPEPLTDPDVYAIYALLLDKPSSSVVLVLRQETIDASDICPQAFLDKPLLADVYTDFQNQNRRGMVLQPMLPLKQPYRLVPRTQIQADYAEWKEQRTPPGPPDVSAVSAVGFNATKDQAIVYVTQSGQGWIGTLEKRAGTWVRVEGGCTISY